MFKNRSQCWGGSARPYFAIKPPSIVMLSALFILALFFSAATAATAQSDEEVVQKLEEMGEEHLLMFYSPGDLMVTSSARRPQPLKRATSAMYVITAEDIRQAGVTTLADLLRLVPGMDVSQQTGFTFAVSARGFAKAESQRLQILLDGMPIYNPYRGGVSFEFLPIFLDNIERIEVIRGSGGVVWGVNAMNGVINIITKKAIDTQGGTIYGGFGNRARQEGFLRLGGSDGKLDWRGTSGGFHNRGLGNDHGKKIEDRFRAFQATGRADLRLSDDTTLTFYGGHKHTSTEISSTRPIQHDSIQYMNLLWSKQLDDESFLRIRWSENFYRRHMDRYNIRTREDMIEVEHSFVSDVHNIVWGVDYTHDFFDTGGNTYRDVTNPDSTHNDQVSAFVEDEITLRDNLWLTIGNRQHHNELTHHDWAGRIALVWEVAPKHFLRAAVARSFRRPLFTEKFQNLRNQNDALKAVSRNSLSNEELISYEIGYRGQLKENLELNVEGFINEHKDLIGKRKVGGINYWENSIDATSYGVETAIDWRPKDWWLLRAFHAYEHQTDENKINQQSTGTLIVFTPPQHKVGLTNRFYLDKKTTLNTQLYWYDTYFSPQGNRIDPFFRLDVRLAKKIWNDNAEIAFGATNLTDGTHYEGDRDVTDEIPRVVYFQFFYYF